MENTLRREFMVKPSECNAQQELPLSLLVAQVIDLATDHANNLGIGFLNITSQGVGWVLSRLSVEMKRWPKNGEKYILSTWVETFNSHFSERNFSVVAETGEPLGYVRTIWTIIDLNTHKGVGTFGMILPTEMIAGSNCPIPKFAKHRHFEPERVVDYEFKYCDLDFYRHVNTVRYITLLLNQFTLQEFDTNTLSRFDIAFAHEAKYGETAVISSIEEEVATPGLLEREEKSMKRSFDITVDTSSILTASITLSERR